MLGDSAARGVPRFLVDEDELRALLDHPFLLGPQDTPLALHARHPYPLPFVPDPAADVALVLEHRADAGRLPAPAAGLAVRGAVVGRRNGFAVEQLRDAREAVAVQVQPEDAADHR